MNGDREPEAAGSRVAFSADTAMAAWMHEIAPFGIFTTDAELVIRSWNQWLVTQSGLAVENVVGRRLFEVFPDLEGRRLVERFERALKGEISVLSTALHQYLLPLPSTTPEADVPFMLQTARIAPLPEGGKVVGTISVIEDVTQREWQASILHRQQEADRLLSSALSKLLQSSDPANDLASIFLSLAPSLGLDAHAAYLFDPEGARFRLITSAGIPPHLRESLVVFEMNADDREPGGAPRFSLTTTRATHLAKLRQIGLRGSVAFPLAIGGRLIGLLSFGSYEVERLPEASVTMLARIARYVAIVIDRSMREREAVAAARAKDNFLAALSHELRTPLNPVLLLASDSAANPDYPASAREAFRAIEKNALLEARLIDDLLDLTKIEHGKLSLEMQRVDVHAILRDALAMVRADASERELTLELTLDAPRSALLGDSGRLQQVFWNILKNAIKFTPRGGRVRVHTEELPANNEIQIQISDTGIGLTELEIARIFDAFSQGEHAVQGRSHRFGGLGLGLAISRSLVQLHCGQIEASSRGRDQGSEFTVRLPLHQPAEAGARPPHPNGVRSSSGDEAASDAKRVGRILLVEDHEPTRSPLTQLLVRRGFDVVAVGTMTAALEAATREAFDLVLSDIGLPDGDGFSLMRKIRERRDVFGIALTGYGMERDVAESNDAGFVTHLTKPISVAVLDRALADAFSRIRAKCD